MFSYFRRKDIEMPRADNALPGRQEPMPLDSRHYVNSRSMTGPFPDNLSQIVLGLGCFWGAEKRFWGMDGVWVTAVGYAAGYTPNPNYEEVCSGMTGHNEVVLVVYDPEVLDVAELLTAFWEAHDPTQGMRQGNDLGTQYRSGIYYCDEEQASCAKALLDAYQKRLSEAGYETITTEILPLEKFYYAEQYHQQYLAKNPDGYCGLGGTGICFE